jgi:hypothetical protein
MLFNRNTATPSVTNAPTAISAVFFDIMTLFIIVPSLVCGGKGVFVARLSIVNDQILL